MRIAEQSEWERAFVYRKDGVSVECQNARKRLTDSSQQNKNFSIKFEKLPLIIFADLQIISADALFIYQCIILFYF